MLLPLHRTIMSTSVLPFTSNIRWHQLLWIPTLGLYVICCDGETVNDTNTMVMIVDVFSIPTTRALVVF